VFSPFRKGEAKMKSRIYIFYVPCTGTVTAAFRERIGLLPDEKKVREIALEEESLDIWQSCCFCVSRFFFLYGGLLLFYFVAQLFFSFSGIELPLKRVCSLVL
jgi:hypothetical protein